MRIFVYSKKRHINVFKLHSRCEQCCPIHPGEQEQLLGAMHLPFIHDGEQIAAVKKGQGVVICGSITAALTRSLGTNNVWLMHVTLLSPAYIKAANVHAFTVEK